MTQEKHSTLREWFRKYDHVFVEYPKLLKETKEAAERGELWAQLALMKIDNFLRVTRRKNTQEES